MGTVLHSVRRHGGGGGGFTLQCSITYVFMVNCYIGCLRTQHDAARASLSISIQSF